MSSIVYRAPIDAGRQLPPWLAGCSVERIEADGGDLVGIWNPVVCNPAQMQLTWHPLADGWQVALIGDLEPRRLLRASADLPDLLPITDGRDRIWHVPAILTPKGGIALSLAVGHDAAGNWARVPSPAQSALIAAARFIRGEFETPADLDGETVSRFSQLPLQVVADTAAQVLASIYAIPPEAFGRLSLLDDRLICQSLLGTSGLMKQ